jgi:hypothetical protein
MKKIIIFLLCLSIIVVGCSKEEEATGDINYKKDVDTLTNSVTYNIDNITLTIRSNYLGISNEDSLFSYMINDNNGMFIVEYKDINNNIVDYDSYHRYSINDKEYLYNYNNDYMNINYVIDNRYLTITIENLNSEFNEEVKSFLLNQLDFEVIIK